MLDKYVASLHRQSRGELSCHLCTWDHMPDDFAAAYVVGAGLHLTNDNQIFRWPRRYTCTCMVSTFVTLSTLCPV